MRKNPGMANNHKRAVSKHKKPSTGDSFEIP